MEVIKRDKTIRQIAFQIRESQLLDYEGVGEVRIFIDGVDLLDEESLGPDPREFFRDVQNAGPYFELIIERSTLEGQLDLPNAFANVRQTPDKIEWFDMNPPLRSVCFDPEQYRRAIAELAKS